MIYLELNDWQLSLWNDQGECLIQQTAGASKASGRLNFGQSALEYSRSHPQQFNNRYLYSLAADPVSGDLSPAKNHADLIYHHLTSLAIPDEPVAICVGGHVTNEQLGLLLGICKETGIAVAGFIDAALAQSLLVPAAQDYHVLDIELHRLTLSHIQVNGTERSCAQTSSLDGMGLANFIEGWMNVIADEFVQKTRFDPLHAGQTEQHLFDQVSQWVSDPEITDRRITILNGETSRDIEVNQTLLTDKLRQRLNRLDLNHVEQLVLSPRAAQIAGFAPLIAECHNEIKYCDLKDLPHNTQNLAAGFTPNSVRRVMTAISPASQAITSPQPAVTSTVTHLLCDHVAHPISDVRFAEQNLTLTSLGERIVIAGRTYTAIRLA